MTLPKTSAVLPATEGGGRQVSAHPVRQEKEKDILELMMSEGGRLYEK
jgi:hypothetical protein